MLNQGVDARHQEVSLEGRKVQDWDEFFEMETSLKEAEIAQIWPRVIDYDEYQALAFQTLLLQGKLDYVGDSYASLMGVSWIHSGRAPLSEPEGDKVTEVDLELAMELRSQALQYRPKRDGVFFRGDGTTLQGTFSIKAPYTKAEFQQGVFWVLDGTLSRDTVISGWRFKPSIWSKKPVSSSEGMMVLYKGKEYKWKYFPTIEVKVENGLVEGKPIIGYAGNSVVEIYYSGTDPVFVRERSHKRPVQPKTWYYRSSLLHFQHEMNLGDQLKTPQLVKGKSVVLRSNITENEVRQMSLEERSTAKELYPIRRSAKATFRTRGGVAVIKEPHKLWDLVGGTLAPGEEEYEGLRREMREEIGCELPVAYRAKIELVSNSVWYEIFLFEIIPPEELSNFVSSESVEAVPWILSYMYPVKTWPIRECRLGNRLDQSHSLIFRQSVTKEHLARLRALLIEYPILLRHGGGLVDVKVQSPLVDVIPVRSKYKIILKSTVPVELRCLWISLYAPEAKPYPLDVSVKAYLAWQGSVSRCQLCGRKTEPRSALCYPCLSDTQMREEKNQQLEVRDVWVEWLSKKMITAMPVVSVMAPYRLGRIWLKTSDGMSHNFVITGITKYDNIDQALKKHTLGPPWVTPLWWRTYSVSTSEGTVYPFRQMQPEEHVWVIDFRH